MKRPKKEQEVADAQAEKVAGYQQCLDVLDAAVKAAEEARFALEPTAPTVPVADLSQGLSRRMGYIKFILRSRSVDQ